MGRFDSLYILPQVYIAKPDGSQQFFENKKLTPAGFPKLGDLIK